jgi:ribosomal protein L9
MEVILRNAIDKLGHPGDIVSVSPGYARNFLLPRGLAYQATPGNLKRIAAEKSRLEALENERNLRLRHQQRHRAPARGAGLQDRKASDRAQRADQVARHVQGADQAARRRAPRNQGVDHQAVSPFAGLSREHHTRSVRGVRSPDSPLVFVTARPRRRFHSPSTDRRGLKPPVRVVCFEATFADGAGYEVLQWNSAPP